MSQYKISTDEVIIQAIKEGKELHNIHYASGQVRKGFPTSCSVENRFVVLQFESGRKEGFSFDSISVPV